MSTYDILDIGSNSVRLYYGGKKVVVTTRLAEGMVGDMLAKSSMMRTADAIFELIKPGRRHYAFATEAVRKAKNRGEFLDLIKARSGLDVHVLSGDEEARLSFLGATCGVHSPAIVIDLGGASCEIIAGCDGKIEFDVSLPFGCVALRDKFPGIVGITEYVESLLSGLPELSGKCFAVGGTVTSLAAMAQKLSVYDPKAVHGYVLSAQRIAELIAEVGVADFPTLSPERRPTIVPGATAILAVMNKLGCDALTVSESDNLEGYEMVFVEK